MYFKNTFIDQERVASVVPTPMAPKMKFRVLQSSEDSTYTFGERKTFNQQIWRGSLISCFSPARTVLSRVGAADGGRVGPVRVGHAERVRQALGEVRDGDGATRGDHAGVLYALRHQRGVHAWPRYHKVLKV